MNDSNDRSEIALIGQPGSPGIAMGRATLFERRQPRISGEMISDDKISQQLDRLKEARERAKEELRQLARGQQDSSAVELIETQIEIINDPELCTRIEAEITENKKAADSAINKVFEEYLTIIDRQQSEVLENRSVDISEIRDRLIHLVHDRNVNNEIEKGSILVARELSPREVIEFADHEIKGILMDRGGTTSHAAIIARSMNIPTIVGLKEITHVVDGDQMVILDGKHGKVMVNPAEKTQLEYQGLIKQQEERKSGGEAICKEVSQTKDQTPFTLRANIEFTRELEAVRKYRAEGIGLLRTESLYLQRKDFGDQQKQEAFYESVLEETSPEPVTIRLFDAGGDKFFEAGHQEQNPFLGWRGIRMLLDEQILLRNQLQALVKVAGRFKGRLRILVPMVSSLEEVFQIKSLLDEVQEQLQKQKEPIDEQIPLGIMVEVPSVALQIQSYAKQVDFLSIGTNDLTQYVMAVDRGNELIANRYDQCHPAMWQLLKQIADGARKAQLPLSVCGEIAGDSAAVCCLMGLGIREFSMIPTSIPGIKQMLRSRSIEEMQVLSQKALNCDTLEEVMEIFHQWNEQK